MAAWVLRLGERYAIEAFLGRAYGLVVAPEGPGTVVYGGPECGWLRVRYQGDRAIGAVRLPQ